MRVCCDIDGVLADITDFYHILPDWDEYYRHTLKLPVIPELIMLVDSLILGGHDVVFITSRPLSTRQDTVLWLLTKVPHLTHPDVWMRPNGDLRPSTDVKMEMVRELKPSLVIEDSPQVVEAMRAEGFIVLQMHGYRLTKEDNIPYSGPAIQKRL